MDAEAKVKNKEADLMALTNAKNAVATNPTPAGFAAAYLLAQNEYNSAVDNEESAAAEKLM
jgi:hypothetical protein